MHIYIYIYMTVTCLTFYRVARCGSASHHGGALGACLPRRSGQHACRRARPRLGGLAAPLPCHRYGLTLTLTLNPNLYIIYMHIYICIYVCVSCYICTYATSSSLYSSIRPRGLEAPLPRHRCLYIYIYIYTSIYL